VILERTCATPCALSCFSRYSESRRTERRCRAVVGLVLCVRGDVVAVPAFSCTVHGCVGPLAGGGTGAAYRSCTPCTEADVAPVLFARAATARISRHSRPPQRQPPGRRTAARVSRCCVHHATRNDAKLAKEMRAFIIRDLQTAHAAQQPVCSQAAVGACAPREVPLRPGAGPPHLV
jgi:hypothetical protein